jgi:hypothetical protein
MNSPIINKDNWKKDKSFQPKIKYENTSYYYTSRIDDPNKEYFDESIPSVTEGVPGLRYVSLLSEPSRIIDRFKLEFAEITEEIEQSSSILTLFDDWDDNGALKIPTNIHGEATQFLKNYALHILDKYNIRIASPSISPVKDGTIDLEWHTPNARFLINFKNNQIASYYGDNNNNLNSIKGRISVLEIEEYLAAWMTKLKQ